MSEKTGRGIIFNGDKLISVKVTRYKNGMVDSEYYTFPGGHIENNETFEETTIREIKEELGINVSIEAEYFHFFNEDVKRDEKFFICKYISGDIGSGDGPEFTDIDYEKYGKYEIVFLDKYGLENYLLYPLQVRNKLIEDIMHGKY